MLKDLRKRQRRPESKDLFIAKLEQSIALLQDVNSIEDAKDLLDVGIMAERWARRKKYGEDAEAEAKKFILRAERKLGELLLGTERNKGGRPTDWVRDQPQINAFVKEGALEKKPVIAQVQVSYETKTIEVPAPTLEQIGISRNLSSEAQRLAAVPEEEFENALAGRVNLRKKISMLVRGQKALQLGRSWRRTLRDKIVRRRKAGDDPNEILDWVVAELSEL